MGCLWSCYESSEEGSNDEGANNYFIVVNNVREPSKQRNVQKVNERSRPYQVSVPKPYFGEYRCSCGRYWSSHLSWPRSYQNCKRCKRPVYPHSQRELRESDKTSGDKNGQQEHLKELCQKCKQLGSYCGAVYKRK